MTKQIEIKTTDNDGFSLRCWDGMFQNPLVYVFGPGQAIMFMREVAKMCDIDAAIAEPDDVSTEPMDVDGGNAGWQLAEIVNRESEEPEPEDSALEIPEGWTPEDAQSKPQLGAEPLESEHVSDKPKPKFKVGDRVLAVSWLAGKPGWTQTEIWDCFWPDKSDMQWANYDCWIYQIRPVDKSADAAFRAEEDLKPAGYIFLEAQDADT